MSRHSRDIYNTQETLSVTATAAQSVSDASASIGDGWCHCFPASYFLVCLQADDTNCEDGG